MADGNEKKLLHKLPVFLSQSVKNDIYLLNYPLRSKNRPYASDTDIKDLKSIRMKPKSNLIELKYQIQVDSVHFNPKNAYPREEVVLTSRKMPNKCNYAMLNMANGKIILTPIKTSLQMLPDFSYINQALSKLKTKKIPAKGKNAQDQNSGERKAEGGKLEAVTSIVQRLEGQEPRLKHGIDSAAQEQWEEMRFSKGKFNVEAVADRLSDSSEKNSLSGKEYLEFLKEKKVKLRSKTPGNQTISAQRFRSIETGLPNHIIRTHLKSFDEKILAILKNCNVVTFQEIEKVLAIDKTKSETGFWNKIISSLSRMAIFLHGVWVCKSEVLFEDRAKFARDFLISLFWRSKDALVSRAEWQRVALLCNEDSIKIFQQISNLDERLKVWRLKKLNKFSVKSFLSEEKLKDQRMFLEKLSFNSYSVLTEGEKLNQEVMFKEHIVNSKIECKTLLEETFSKYGLCKMTFLLKKLRKRIRDFEVMQCLAFTSQQEFEKIVREFCHSFEGDIHVQKIPNNPILDGFRIAAIEYLQEKKIASKEAIRSFVEKKTLRDPSGSLHKIISDFCVVSGTRTFSLKLGDFRI